MNLNRASQLCSALLLTVFLSAGSVDAALTIGAGSQFTWDGISGPPLAKPPVPGTNVVPDNIALASRGGTSFAIDSGHMPTHNIPNLNNGRYGNSDSWIGVTERDINVGGGTIVTSTFAGIDFAGSGLQTITSFAFGRSNIEAEFADRHLGTYYVQLAGIANPGVNTPDDDWRTIGSISILGDPDEHRHHFTLDAPDQAYGIRIVTPGAGTAIDEIEVFPVPEPAAALLGLSSLLCLVLLRRRK